MKQQFALYLMHKKRFSDAFLMIDKAVADTYGRNFSISNTHAIILFKANINSDSDSPVVLSSIKESMEILSKCYHSDKRKEYHVKVFADHTIQFSKIYGSKSSLEYINTAILWLGKELEKYPNRRLEKLKTVLEKILQL